MIELIGASRTYKIGAIEVNALRTTNLKIEQGEFVAIIGPSGSGKSTLLHILGFLDRPDKGTYRFQGKDVTALGSKELALLRNQMIGFIFQQFHLLPRLSAIQNAMLPLIYGGKGHFQETASEKIRQVGLGHRADHVPNELSGGEQQRVSIARALVNDPLLLLADEPTGNLDSKSESEIISILEGLNHDGKTIIMVTHEKSIAERASRIIQMHDGKIVSDTYSRQPSAGMSEMAAAKHNMASQKTGLRRTAEFLDHLKQSFQSIIGHKMRSVLSMLGILIGVGAVIAMLAVAGGARESISENLSKLGSNLLMIWPESHNSRQGVSLGAGAVPSFTLEDAMAMKKLPLIRRASPYISGRVQLVYGNKNWNSRLEGTGTDYPEMKNIQVQTGRFFTEEELRSRDRVAVLGVTIVSELFGEENPLGCNIRINRVNFRVIGVLKPRGGGHWDNDDVIMMPVTTAMYRMLGRKYVDRMEVEVRNAEMIGQAQEDIKDLLAKRHHLNNEARDNVSIRDMTEIQNMLNATTKTMSWLLGSIAAISLLVGGIGIMNIMLVSVTERTHEIGLRKAIGARDSDIMLQFLIESVVMTVTGGLCGIMLGCGVAVLLSKLAEWPIKVSLFSIVLSVTFSMAIGLLFGILPARQASKLDPIKALRYE